MQQGCADHHAQNKRYCPQIGLADDLPIYPTPVE
jgi:hypothetical protein